MGAEFNDHYMGNEQQKSFQVTFTQFFLTNFSL